MMSVLCYLTSLVGLFAALFTDERVMEKLTAALLFAVWAVFWELRKE